MEPKEQGACSTCGKVIMSDGVMAGYGVKRETGAKVCYACCAVDDKRDMIERGRAVMYLTDNDKVVCNWPGSLKFDVLARWQSGWSCFGQSKVTWVRFIGPDGAVWSGRHSGNWNEIIHVKRTKLTDVYA